MSSARLVIMVVRVLTKNESRSVCQRLISLWLGAGYLIDLATQHAAATLLASRAVQIPAELDS